MHSTPQQTSLVEVEFATISGHARAMCNAANMNERVHILIANEVLMFSTALCNLVMNKDNSMTHHQKMGLQNPKWYETGVIHTFGEAGVVMCGKNGKLCDRGLPMVFVGCAENPSSDCNCMWNPASCKVTESHDIICYTACTILCYQRCV